MLSSRYLFTLLLLLTVSANTLSQTPAIPNQPFTAVKKSTTIQKLADGTSITRVITITEARDSQGRLMQKNDFLTPPRNGQLPPAYSIMVQDPVAQTRTHWMVPGKEASVVHSSISPVVKAAPTNTLSSFATAPLAASSAAGGAVSVKVVHLNPSSLASAQAPVSDPNNLRPAFKMEKLDGKSINGIYAVGTKVTTTFPIDFFGNDRPIIQTRETWTSPDLKLIIASTDEDPRSGTTTTELVSLDRAEPDPSLFTPPQGYQIKETIPQQ